MSQVSDGLDSDLEFKRGSQMSSVLPPAPCSGPCPSALGTLRGKHRCESTNVVPRNCENLTTVPDAQALRDKMQASETQTNARFDEMNVRFDEMNAQFDQLQNSVDAMRRECVF